METKSLYLEGHLVLAMIRILDHKNKMPPTISATAEGLDFSLEQTNLICLKLKEKGIIDMVEDAYDVRLFIKDHLLLEELEKDGQEDRMQKALAEFQEKKKGLSTRVEQIQATQQAKQQKLFSELDALLKKKSAPGSKNFKIEHSGLDTVTDK
jgi:hypothetical protein